MASGPQTAATVAAAMVTSGARSRRELERALGRSKAAISRTVDGLLRHGFLEGGAKLSAPGRGRKTTLLHVRGDLAYLLGTDLEGEAVRACLIDCSRRTIASGKRAIGARWTVGRILEQWEALLEDVLKDAGVPREEVACMGVGLPGVVRRGTLCTHAFLPPGQWVDLDAQAALGRFGWPIRAANNVVCAAEYERRLGVARGAASFLSIVARYGLGAVLCGNDAILIGEESLATELGHMRIDVRGPRCVCGRRGCLDVFVSGRTLPPREARKGVAWERELARRGRHLSVGIANLLKVFHPSLVVLNGIYNEYAERFGPILDGALDAELLGVGLARPKVVFGDSAEFKVSIGAALRAGDAFLARRLLAKGMRPRARRSAREERT